MINYKSQVRRYFTFGSYCRIVLFCIVSWTAIQSRSARTLELFESSHEDICRRPIVTKHNPFNTVLMKAISGLSCISGLSSNNYLVDPALDKYMGPPGSSGKRTKSPFLDDNFVYNYECVCF